MAVLLVLVAALARFTFPAVFEGTPYLAFFPAVAVSAVIGGCGPGVLATLLTLIAVDLLLDSSFMRLGFESLIWDARQAIFLGSGIGISLLARMLEAARTHERRQAAEIAEQRNKYRIVADNTYDWEFWINPEGRFLYNSPSCKNVTGYEAEEFINSPDLIYRIIHPDDRAAYDEHHGGDGPACKAPNIEYRIIRGDGEVRWIHHSCVPVQDDEGRSLGIRGTNRDITDRKKVELDLIDAKRSADRAKAAAEEANQAKDRFLAMLSHELRTPLTPVFAAVSMLRKHPHPDSVMHSAVEMIHRNIEMEARIIDDLLDINRIMRGKIELNKRSVELRSVIDRAVEVCRPDMQAKGLQLNLSFGNDVGYVVEADSGRLQQVFWNLLRNAVKFTPEGGSVSVCCRLDGNGGVVTEVRDTGMGIEPEAIGRLFDAFVQADQSVTRQYGGLGLGLAISKTLVALHGGTIEGQSPGKGKGATFRVRLPLASPRVNVMDTQPRDSTPAEFDDSPSVTSNEPTSNEPQSASNSLRMLLVEDHADSAEMLRLMLESEGHQLEVVGSIAAAMDKFSRDTFDMFICDLGLPDGSGLDLMRNLRSGGKSLPGIAVSGYGQEQDVRQSREAGFADHMTKPVDMDRLLAVVKKVAASSQPA